MEYKKPEITFKKFYTDSFLAPTEILSANDGGEGGDLEHIVFDSIVPSSGANGWMNG